MKDASVEELASVEGIGAKQAQLIWNFFRAVGAGATSPAARPVGPVPDTAGEPMAEPVPDTAGADASAGPGRDSVLPGHPPVADQEPAPEPEETGTMDLETGPATEDEIDQVLGEEEVERSGYSVDATSDEPRQLPAAPERPRATPKGLSNY